MKLTNFTTKIYFMSHFKIEQLDLAKKLSLKFCPNRLQKIKNMPPYKQFSSLMAFWLLIYALKCDLKIKNKINFFEINGKPHLKQPLNLFFNLSHTKNAATCAIANNKIGIDIEADKFINFKLAQKICSKSEITEFFKSKHKKNFLLQLWTVKESFVKMNADSIFLNLKKIDYKKIKNVKSFKVQEFFTSVCCKNVLDFKFINLNFNQLVHCLNKLS